MRHRAKSVKLSRTSQHRDAMLASLVVSLIERKQISTTVAKAKAMRPLAEKMVTLGKRGDLAARRLAIARIGSRSAVGELFSDLAPRFKERQGGYTRLIKTGFRASDAAPMAIVQWTEATVSAGEAEPSPEAATS